MNIWDKQKKTHRHTQIQEHLKSPIKTIWFVSQIETVFLRMSFPLSILQTALCSARSERRTSCSHSWLSCRTAIQFSLRKRHIPTEFLSLIILFFSSFFSILFFILECSQRTHTHTHEYKYKHKHKDTDTQVYSCTQKHTYFSALLNE